MARFEPCGLQDKRYGVYDTVAGRWIPPLDLSPAGAAKLAAILNDRFGDDTGPGPEEVVIRWPAVRVQAAIEWKAAGTVDVAIREYDRRHHQPVWLARIQDDEGNVSWCPARDLRFGVAAESSREASP
jgi:hypothetical protein